MSLLMEALRKAEEAKRKGQEQQTPAEPPQEVDSNSRPEAAAKSQPAFTLEPLDIPPPAVEQLHRGDMAQDFTPPYQRDSRERPVEPSLTMGDVDNFLDTAAVAEESTPPRSRRTRSSGPTRDQLAAASVFAASKQAPKRNKHLKVLVPVLALTIPMIGIGLWFVYQLQGDSLAVNPSLANYNPAERTFLNEQSVVADLTIAAADVEMQAQVTLPAQSLEVADPPAPEMLSASDRFATTAPTPVEPETVAATAAGTIVETAPEIAAEAAPQPVIAPVSAPGTPAQTSQAGIQLPAADPASNTRLQISRSASRPQVNSVLQSAWNTLQAGDMGRAMLLYQEVLAELPTNRDALLGLAAIQERSGQSGQARQLYVQLLALNPQDPLARAGLLQGMQAGTAPAQEGELRALLNRYPELAPLHFALGNLFAGQQRWSEAQNAYFTALLYAGRGNDSPISPDYAFNLAVSLEQLQQPRAALDYYRQARDLALTSSPGFDPEQLRSRLAYLEQNHP